MNTIIVSGNSNHPLFLSFDISHSKDLKDLNKIFLKHYSDFSPSTWARFFLKIHSILERPVTSNQRQLKCIAGRNMAYLQTAEALKIKFNRRNAECVRSLYNHALRIILNYSTNTKHLDDVYLKHHSKFSDSTWSIFFNKIHSILDEVNSKCYAERNMGYLRNATALKIEFLDKDEKCLNDIYNHSINILYKKRE